MLGPGTKGSQEEVPYGLDCSTGACPGNFTPPIPLVIHSVQPDYTKIALGPPGRVQLPSFPSSSLERDVAPPSVMVAI